MISGVVYFRKNILGSSRNVSETAPRASAGMVLTLNAYKLFLTYFPGFLSYVLSSQDGR